MQGLQKDWGCGDGVDRQEWDPLRIEIMCEYKYILKLRIFAIFVFSFR